MSRAAIDWGVEGSGSEEELIERCVAALEEVYDGSCVEECLRPRAEAFVASGRMRLRAA